MKKSKKKVTKAQNGYPNAWEMQGNGMYQYPGYQPMDAYNYQSPYPPVTDPISPQSEMQIQPIQQFQQLQQPSQQKGPGMGGMAAGIGRGVGQAMSAFAIGAPQLINALLPEEDRFREDMTIPRALNRYPQGNSSQAIYEYGGELKKYPKGGKVEPIYTRDPNDPRLQAYNDSLNLHNISTETYRLKRIHENAVKLHQNKQGSYENTTKTLNNLFEYIYNTEDTYDKARERLNNPTPIILPKYAFDVPIYKKPVQPIIYRENPPLEQMTQLDTEPFPTYREEPPTLKKLGRMMNVPYSYERGSGLGWRRESGYRPEYVEYKDGGYIKKTRKAGKKGRIQVTEEIPLEDNLQPLPQRGYVDRAFSFKPQPVNLPPVPEQRDISFQRMVDVHGQPTAYLPQFQGYSYNEATQALPQLPESFGGVPVVRSPQNYLDFFQGFLPGTQSSQWTPYDTGDYTPLPLTPFEYGGEIEAKSGIKINPKNKGKFTASAKRAGMGVQEFASHVLANKEDYSSTQVKRANFAKSATKFKHEFGGIVEGAEMDLSADQIQQLLDNGYEIDIL